MRVKPDESAPTESQIRRIREVLRTFSVREIEALVAEIELRMLKPDGSELN